MLKMKKLNRKAIRKLIMESLSLINEVPDTYTDPKEFKEKVKSLSGAEVSEWWDFIKASKRKYLPMDGKEKRGPIPSALGELVDSLQNVRVLLKKQVTQGLDDYINNVKEKLKKLRNMDHDSVIAELGVDYADHFDGFADMLDIKEDTTKKSGGDKKKKSKWKKAPTLKDIMTNDSVLTKNHASKDAKSTVILLQKLLSSLASVYGGKKIKADGYFGSGTESALEQLLMTAAFKKDAEVLYKHYEESYPSDIKSGGGTISVGRVLFRAIAQLAARKKQAIGVNALKRIKIHWGDKKELGDIDSLAMNESFGLSRGSLLRSRYRKY
jgi:hypothetical protein